MKIKTVIFLIMLSSICSAQAPWRAKLFVHFLDSNNTIVTDTVWFGCDSLGDIGFQQGLDVIDTGLKWNKVYSADDIVKSQFNTDCGNLKTNIREFKKDISFFFYAIGNPIAISWDTLDYYYRDSVFPLVYIELESLSGYLNTLDAVKFDIGGDVYIQNGDEYIYKGFYYNPKDSIQLFGEGNLNSCSIQKGFNFKLNALLSNIKLAIDDINGGLSFSLYPNPIQNTLNVHFDQLNTGLLKLTNHLGIETTVVNYNRSEQLNIDLSTTPNGLYCLTLSDKDNQIIHTQKIIIQH
jgi:hypothetical protein